MTGWWTELPTGRVVRLRGASPEAVALSLDPLPDDAPAVVMYNPRPAVSVPEAVTSVLDELETVAISLYPHWLPEARGIDGPAGGGLAAVAALAREMASATPHFSQFLVDLAGRALTRQVRRTGKFSAEVRAGGLVRVIADSFRRERAALLVRGPEALGPAAEQSLVAAYEWLADRGSIAVWLTGTSWTGAGRVKAVTVHLPYAVTDLVAGVPERGRLDEPLPPVMTYPAIRGLPRPDSKTEQALEAALAFRPWAVGRVWNETYEPHPLAMRYQVDLMWAAERCVVEIDGPEHRTAAKFEADRRRDVELQLDGFVVLRFTNERVHQDLDAVLFEIERMILIRRPGKLER